MSEARELQKPRGPGRPKTEWSEDLVNEICDHLATGKSLIDIGRLQGYPSSDTMYRQMARDPEFAARIARGREAGQDHEADAIIQMADMASNEDWQVVKLRIWARQWRAAKLNSKYSDKVRHVGADGGAIQLEDKTAFDARNLPPEQREALRLILASAVAQHVETQGPVLEGDYSVTEDDDA